MTTHYDAPPPLVAQLERAFTYHPPTADQIERYAAIRTNAGAFAAEIVALTPPSREQSLALTQLESAVMWANAAIARNETPK